MTIISQFILHSSLAFHNNEHATVSSIEFTLLSIKSSIDTPYSILASIEYRVSSVNLHLGGTVMNWMS